MEQGFVAQVGGVTTLLNESQGNIYPGDKVMLDLNLSYARPVTRDKGIPREKVRFTVARAVTKAEVISQAMSDVGLKTALMLHRLKKINIRLNYRQDRMRLHKS